MKTFEEVTNEILREIREEEKIKEQKRKEIVAKGCRCDNKVERTGLFSKEKYLECPVCHKQYRLDGTEII